MKRYLMILTLVAFVLATVVPGVEAAAKTPNTPVGKAPAKVAAKKPTVAKKVKTRKKRRPHRQRGVTHHYFRSGIVLRNR